MDLFLLHFFVGRRHGPRQVAIFQMWRKTTNMNVCVCVCMWIHHALSQSFIRRGSCLMPNKIFWNFNYFRLSVRVCLCVCVSWSVQHSPHDSAPLLLPLTVAHCAAQCDSWQQASPCVCWGFCIALWKIAKLTKTPKKQPSLRAWLTKWMWENVNGKCMRE